MHRWKRRGGILWKYIECLRKRVSDIISKIREKIGNSLIHLRFLSMKDINPLMTRARTPWVLNLWETQGYHGTLEHKKLNSYPYASPRTNTGTHPSYLTSHPHIQIETFSFTNTLIHYSRSAEPSQNDIHIQFRHGVNTDIPPILKGYKCHRTAGPTHTPTPKPQNYKKTSSASQNLNPHP